ncbi:MAG: homoserine O-acetyltransferase [Acidimicrobiia bacterium]|nr:homoserine O-acetyltransferase [Acidimicrobiia bacterium]NNF89133.1 homoserine O-acetyltransferase [Acidimicrobiia bacterium]
MRTETRFFTSEEPLALDGGTTLPGFTLAYEQYGELNAERDNAILVFHALTGSQHAAGRTDSVPGVGDRWTAECQTGWWDPFIGPGRALDTDRFAVFCVNYLGGCYGSTGPASENPETGTPYGGSFPEVSVDDIVNSQLRLLDELGIESLHAVIGASLGALMCLSLATRFPDRVDLVVPIAGGLEVTALQFIHNFEQVNAIVNDPSFQGGDYYAGQRPDQGLALARMIGHKTFVSLAAMEDRARSEVVDPHEASEYIHITHPIESYLWHQGQKFVQRFDANSYLRLMEAWQGFDLLASVGAESFQEALRPCKNQSFMVFSIDSDVCFYPEEQERMMRVLKSAGVPARRITVHSEKGHDSFLLEPSLFAPHLRQTLEQPWGVD